MGRTLVIGYGNLDRADDGVGLRVINALRASLNQKLLSEDENGMEELGNHIDSIFMVQLVPELMDLLVDYDRVVFVDAHVYPDVPELHCTRVLPDYRPSAFTHHMSPSMFLALARALSGRAPEGHLVSIRGYDFDFHRELSPQTRRHVEPAAQRIIAMVSSCDCADEGAATV